MKLSMNGTRPKPHRKVPFIESFLYKDRYFSANEEYERDEHLYYIQFIC